MTAPQIIYEQPLSERIRTLLRLEHLFGLSSHHLKGQSSLDSRSYVSSLIDLLDVFSRGDIKNELLKEMERSTTTLKNLMSNPKVDSSRLTTILKAMEHLIDNLYSMKSQPGSELRGVELIAAVRQRSSIPGGTCAFDLPLYHRWLQQPWSEREREQKQWFAMLDPIRQAIELLLKMIRNSADPITATCTDGTFQQALDSSQNLQMIRVYLPANSPYFAEISGSRHRFNLRFLHSVDGKLVTAEEPVSFKYSCCSL